MVLFLWFNNALFSVQADWQSSRIDARCLVATVAAWEITRSIASAKLRKSF
jgi:hypothetical protein